MIPTSFDYFNPTTIEDAIAAKIESGPEAIFLAGGQSLITDLKLRNKKPSIIIDLSAIPNLDEIKIDEEALTVGAMARQTDIVTKAQEWGLLKQVANAAADPMVRRRGTLVGAFCEIDPFGDWVAAGLALNASLTIGTTYTDDHGNPKLRTKKIALSDFIKGPKKNALEIGEIALSATIPRQVSGLITIYNKVKHSSVGWSVASTAITYNPDGNKFTIAISGAVNVPVRLFSLEQALETIDLNNSVAIDNEISEALKPLIFIGDNYASAKYRKHRLAILLKRTVSDLTNKNRL